MHRFSFEDYRKAKCRRFSRFFMEPAILQACKSWRRPLQPVERKPKEAEIVRLIVRWHPSISGLGAALAKQCNAWRPILEQLGGRIAKLKVQVGFELAARPLHLACRA